MVIYISKLTNIKNKYVKTCVFIKKLISIKKELDEGLQMIFITKPFSMFGHTRKMCTLKAHFFPLHSLDNVGDGGSRISYYQINK
jgi:hypothetical protein